MGGQLNLSLDVIQQMVNAMIGGAMLILPILFVQGGLILSFGILALSGFICYQTCTLYMNHLKPEEKDISEVIQRVLGKNWYMMFNILSCVYLFLVCMLYFLLLCDMFYQICEFGMISAGNDNYAPKNIITVDEFGMFYIAIIIIVPTTILVFIKNQTVLNKITQYGVYAIYLYLFFILFVFFTNIDRGLINEGISKVPLFSLDIGHLAGTCSLAFTLHTAFVPILKQDKNYKQNGKNNLKYSYLGGFLIYLFIGAIGGLGIIGRKAFIQPPQSITEYFAPTDIPPLIVEIVYFCNLFTVLPCFFGIFRSRFLNFIYQNEEIPEKAVTIVNLFYLIFSFTVRCIPTIRAGDIMSANGAISCFFIVYLIPIFLHLKCYHGKGNVIHKKKHTEETDYIKPDITDIDNEYSVNKSRVDNDSEQIVCYQECCNDHADIDKYPKSVRFTVYGCVFMIGFSILCYGLFNIFIRNAEEAKTGAIPGNMELLVDGESDGEVEYVKNIIQLAYEETQYRLRNI